LILLPESSLVLPAREIAKPCTVKLSFLPDQHRRSRRPEVENIRAQADLPSRLA
jgi:hypothetical protein